MTPRIRKYRRCYSLVSLREKLGDTDMTLSATCLYISRRKSSMPSTCRLFSFSVIIQVSSDRLFHKPVLSVKYCIACTAPEPTDTNCSFECPLSSDRLYGRSALGSCMATIVYLPSSASSLTKAAEIHALNNSFMIGSATLHVTICPIVEVNCRSCSFLALRSMDSNAV